MIQKLDKSGKSSIDNANVVILDKNGNVKKLGGSSPIISAALTKTDDTNVTLTLGGSPSTALLAATSLTVGWTGTLADSRITSAAIWNAKQDALGFTAENVANKQNSLTVDGTGTKYPTVDAVNAGITNSSYWTKTGDDIRNNNIGNVQLKLQSAKQVQILNSANTQVGFIDENGTYRAGTATQYVTVGLLGGNTWMSMVRSQASMGVILGNPQVSQAFVTSSTNYFGSSYIAGSNEVAAVANAEHSFNIGNAVGNGITSGIFRISRTRLQSTVPVKYATDLSASYDDRTLVDKAYADTKQPTLSGTGFVVSTAGVITYDTNVYYLASNPSGYTNNIGTVTSVAALTIGTTGTDLSSTVATGTTTPVITLNVPTASASNRGVLSSADWTTFNNKQDVITLGNLTNASSDGITITGGTNAINGTGVEIFQQVANTTQNGYLSSIDWTTFNGKQNPLSGTGFVKSTAGVISYDTSTYITGNQSITLSGAVTGTGTTAITTSLSNSVVGIANLTATGTPSATTYLRGDNTWATVTSGGTPGGTVNEIQYNDGAGGFAGAANVEIESGNLKLVSTTDPVTPTGGLIQYAKVIAGRVLPKIIGPSGIDTIMQVGLHGNSVFLISPANGTTAPSVTGGVITTATTISHQQTIASSAPWQATRRTRFQTSTTINNATGARTAYTQWFRGSAAGFGGFWFRCQLGQNINITGGQKFVGLCNSTGALAGQPSALLNMCGMGFDSTDLATGNWFFMYNDGTGTATRVDLGANAVRNTTAGYDLIMYMAPGGSELFVRIVNIATNVVVLETSYTTLLPVANTGMAFKAEVRTTTAAADNIEIAKVYIETDY